MKLKKQTKTIISNTKRPSTIGTMELLSREQIDTQDHQKCSYTWLPHIATARVFLPINHVMPV